MGCSPWDHEESDTTQVTEHAHALLRHICPGEDLVSGFEVLSVLGTPHTQILIVKPDHQMDVDLLSQKQRAWSRDQGKQDPAAISKLQIEPRSSIS